MSEHAQTTGDPARPHPMRGSLSSVHQATKGARAHAQRRFQRHVLGRSELTMIPGSLAVDGLEMRYGISSNQPGDGSQRWVLNLHGFLAGATTYNRESERLAESFGWRVLNPSLPGFGGSEPLPWGSISMASLVRRVEALVEHFGMSELLLIGHSMGAGVAIEYAAEHPERVLGIIYRDGIATPAWHDRGGPIPFLVSTVAPDLAPLADLVASTLLDVPDLLMGRALSTLRSLLPDLRHNVKVLAHAAPLGSMLMAIDQSDQVAKVRLREIPILAEWGCFDHVATKRTATEFSELAGVPIQWVPGGHSWMLGRPSGQVDVLRHLPSGQAFLSAVEDRSQALAQLRPRLRSVASVAAG
jgi:pimeloyl-ACP methyl ester carboxylesterase